MHKEQLEALKAEQEAARNALRNTRDLSPTERVAEFMKQANSPTVASTTAVVHGQIGGPE